MPVKNGVGYSNTTPDKAYGLEKLLSQHLAVVKAIYKSNQKAPYFYFDCTAGPGYIEDVEVPGSPLIFLKCATLNGIVCTGFFIERDENNYKHLCENLRNYPYNPHKIIIKSLNEEYENILSTLILDVPPYSYGLIYFDPTTSLDFDFLSRIFLHSNLDRVDLLIHISATTMKRLQKPLAEEIKKIAKTNWIIRDVYPTGRDSHQMTFLLGMNWNGLRAMKNHRFYNVDSDKGREIMTYLSQPKAEYFEKSKAQVGYRGWW
ncbi:MAG: three-Cys-motif partner protein TcmP [Paludibacter sp.]|nr:three-Cys-motif partner protein TcmP [Paludibacter sp.]